MEKIIIPSNFKEFTPKVQADFFFAEFMNYNVAGNIADGSLGKFKKILDLKFDEKNNSDFTSVIKYGIVTTIEWYFGKWYLGSVFSNMEEIQELFPSAKLPDPFSNSLFLSTCFSAESYVYIRMLFRNVLMETYARRTAITNYLSETYGIKGTDINKF